ncbi:MAG TPA: RsmG family class I SAM-dependent methyltransferase, partial [Clostridia bacterium]|nr:RsmG family class I SAM-dependent methyltransferase [Clostridia bacterium]
KRDAYRCGDRGWLPWTRAPSGSPRSSCDARRRDSKKVAFLQNVIGILRLDKATALHARAEELGRDSRFRDQFDIAVARAVTALPVLSELCLPLVKPGGRFIAMKGQDDETTQSDQAIHLLGGKLEEVFNYDLPGMDAVRSLVIVNKTKGTPSRYPRRMVNIRKSPL